MVQLLNLFACYYFIESGYNRSVLDWDYFIFSIIENKSDSDFKPELYQGYVYI